MSTKSRLAKFSGEKHTGGVWPASRWVSLVPQAQEDAISNGVLLTMTPMQWTSMVHDLDDKAEALRVANMKLQQTENRLRSVQSEHAHEIEALRHELTRARDEVSRVTRVMHAMIDGLAGPESVTNDRLEALSLGD